MSGWPLIKCAIGRWARDQAATLGAALAFYCAFSLAPLLIIVVTVTGWIIGAESAYGQLSAQLTSLFGAATARVLLQAMKSSQDAEGVLATVLSIASLIVGATTVFAALESALERIWRAQTLAPTCVYGWLRASELSFGLILAVGFLLLVSLTVSTALSALRDGIRARFEGFTLIVTGLDVTISLALVAALIAVCTAICRRDASRGGRCCGAP